MELPFKRGQRVADVRLSNLGGTSKALHDFLGRKAVVFVWASWCPSRGYLKPLQKFHETNPGIPVISIACDVQGVDLPMRYLKEAGADYETWIDSNCILGRRWGLKRVPACLLLDEQGCVMAAAKFPDGKFLAAARRLSSKKPSGRPPRDPRADVKNTRVEILVEACTNFLGRGRKDEALEALKMAATLDPESRIIPRQILAIRNPERFYSGAVDGEWVRGQEGSRR